MTTKKKEIPGKVEAKELKAGSKGKPKLKSAAKVEKKNYTVELKYKIILKHVESDTPENAIEAATKSVQPGVDHIATELDARVRRIGKSAQHTMATD